MSDQSARFCESNFFSSYFRFLLTCLVLFLFLIASFSSYAAPIALSDTFSTNEEVDYSGFLWIALDGTWVTQIDEVITYNPTGYCVVTDTGIDVAQITGNSIAINGQVVNFAGSWPNFTFSGTDTFSTFSGTMTSSTSSAVVGTLYYNYNDGYGSCRGRLDVTMSRNIFYTLTTLPTKGTVQITDMTTGAFTYTPNINATGSDTFSFTANDGTGASNSATMTITINALNDVPTVSGGSVLVSEDTPYLGVLTAADVDGDTLTHSIVTQPTQGSVVITNPASGAFTYTPNLNVSGGDSFTFQVSDGAVTSGVATMSITISAVNDPPSATNLNAPESFIEDAAPFSMVKSVITDSDSTTVTATLTLSESGAGSLSTATSGGVTSTFIDGVWRASGAVANVNLLLAGVKFTPAANWDQSFTMTISISDGVASALTGSKSFTVTPVNDLPTLTGTPATTATPDVLYTFAPGASDVDGSALSFAIQNKPSWATFDSSTGVLSGTPVAGDYGPYNDIVISVTAGTDTLSLPLFAIYVEDNAKPVALDISGGVFNDAQSVELACLDGGSGCQAIYYTLDGTAPTLNSLLYTGPISISSSAVLNYVAVDRAGQFSSVVTKNFTIDATSPQLALTAPENGATLNRLFDITGWASDDGGSGVDEVALQITDGTNYLVEHASGSIEFLPTPAWLTATSTDGWSRWNYLTNNLWESEKSYTITARAVDLAGNIGFAQHDFLFFTGEQAFSTISMDLGSQAILQNDTVDLSGKLTRLPENGKSLLGLPISIQVLEPSGQQVALVEVVTTTDLGHFQALGLSGFTEKGVYTIHLTYGGSLSLAASERSKTISVGSSAGYAIIVEGRVNTQDGLESHNKTANRIYQHFLDRQFQSADIQYFNYDIGQAGVDGLPNRAVVQEAIENWAAQKMNDRPAPLYLVMVDHGNVNTFYLDSEIIAPTDLGDWLTTLEGKLDDAAKVEPRIVILGACYSGSFMPALGGEMRVVISSAAADEVSYKGPKEADNIRSGEYFLEELFQELGRGASLGDAFQMASANTATFTRRGGQAANSSSPFLDNALQHPLLDDNGDGVGVNDLAASQGDGAIASRVFLGAGITNAVAKPSDIIQVAPTVYLTGELQAPLWVKTANNGQTSSVWAMVRPPSLVLVPGTSTEQSEIDLTPQLLSLPYLTTEADVWQATLAGFELPGKYEIFYMSFDLNSERSPLMRGVVYQSLPGNNGPAPFNLLLPADNAQTSTVLSFSWEPSTDPDQHALTYTLLIGTGVSSGQVENVVHRQEELESTITFVDVSAALVDLTDYYWQVQAVDAYGAVTNSSQVWHFRTNNTNNLPGAIQGIVLSDLDFSRLAGVTITVNGTSVETMADGTFLVMVNSAGEVNLSGVQAGYIEANLDSIVVEAGLVTRVNITLQNLANMPFSLDLDADGHYDPLTDGLLAIRYLYDMYGDLLINGVVDTQDGMRKTAEEISTFIEANQSALDVDGSGVADPGSDGMLILRYLFGFRGDALTQGDVVSGGASRTTAEDIGDYINTLMPAKGS